jgi:hypothetical protein
LSDAITTGLIGSASYDLMKLAIRQTLERLGRRAKPVRGEPPANEVITSYVQLAVVE